MTRVDPENPIGEVDSAPGLLNAYDRKRFSVTDDLISQRFPLKDELFVDTWQSYVAHSGEISAFEQLKKHFPQLLFPIVSGISNNRDYRAATLKGRDPNGFSLASGLCLESPNDILLSVHSTDAGRIPVLVAPVRSDFEKLVCALSARNEPINVPQTMGACFISQLNNWGRIRHYHDQNPALNIDQCLRQIIDKKYLYQDSLILLSTGEYSQVNAEILSLDRQQWLDKSLLLRLHHEATHYLMLRLFGSTENHLFDELLCDFVGICSAGDGIFHGKWFLNFMGLENAGRYRIGGRLENYFSDVQLSDEDFPALQIILRKAASNIETFSKENQKTCDNLTYYTLALASLTLTELADRASVNILNKKLSIIIKAQQTNLK